MFQSISNTIQLLKTSYTVLRKDKEILLFPVISTIITSAMIISFVFLFYYEAYSGSLIFPTGEIRIPIYFSFFVSIVFVGMFFQSGLLVCAHIRLNGKDPTFRDGITIAEKNVRRIFLWSLSVATIYLVSRFVERKFGMAGSIASAGMEISWSVATYLVLPILLFEKTGFFSSFKKSATLLKKSWAENLLGQTAFGVISFLIIFPGVIALGAGFGIAFGEDYFLPILGICLAYVFFVLIIISSLEGIYKTAVYNYAVSGKIPDVFRSNFVESSFKPD